MTKQIILLILISIVAMFLQHQLVYVLHGLLYLHHLIASCLAMFFSNGPVGRAIQGIISLIVVPGLAGGLAALVFWLIKHVSMPHAMGTVWIVWLIMLITILAQGLATGVPA